MEAHLETSSVQIPGRDPAPFIGLAAGSGRLEHGDGTYRQRKQLSRRELRLSGSTGRHFPRLHGKLRIPQHD